MGNDHAYQRRLLITTLVKNPELQLCYLYGQEDDEDDECICVSYGSLSIGFDSDRNALTATLGNHPTKLQSSWSSNWSNEIMFERTDAIITLKYVNATYIEGVIKLKKRGKWFPIIRHIHAHIPTRGVRQGM